MANNMNPAIDSKGRGFPDYDNRITVPLSSYICPNDGYILVVRLVATAAGSQLSINGKEVIAVNPAQSPGTEFGGMCLPVKKGDTVTVTNVNTQLTAIRFLQIRY